MCWAQAATAALKSTLLLFDSFYDVEAKAKVPRRPPPAARRPLERTSLIHHGEPVPCSKRQF